MSRQFDHAAYVWVVIAVGLAAVGHAGWATVASPPDVRWAILCVLTLAGAIATLKLRAAPISFSISDSFTFSTLLLFGPGPATITASLEALTISCVLSSGQRRMTRALFNIAAVGFAMWTAGHMLPLAEAMYGGKVQTSPAWLVLATTAAIGTYFLVNTWTVAVAVALEQQQRAIVVWRTHFLHLAFAYGAGAYTALLLVLLAPSFDTVAFALLAPLPLVLYASVRLWFSRLNERVAYLDRTNRQYRATIEALAHAVDAKDQVTHGHIRRVQNACVQVAREIGCADECELQAIEAASLLHDLGKIAIPEHILNKPGPLTPAEYARIKEHAAIGADILSGIEFPYPVVPIVRHHHENWDGSGYPDGLAGSQIPLGARVLAVVDCFDALTSDRPYRPAMSREQALEILQARRGTMYDPDVVDRFAELAPTIEVAVNTPGAEPEPATVPVAPTSRPFQAHETSPLAVIAGPALALMCRSIAASAGVVYRYDEDIDALTPSVTVGLSAQTVASLKMRVGERLSGWVAAHRRTQVGADARLDLPGACEQPTLAISAPIARDGALLGVVTVYGSPAGQFDGGSPVTVELLAALLADVKQGASSALLAV